MNAFSNALSHPRTTATGLLIATISIADVLAGQGISMGRAGTGSVLTLVTALSTALLGVIARDPGQQAPPAEIDRNKG